MFKYAKHYDFIICDKIWGDIAFVNKVSHPFVIAIKGFAAFIWHKFKLFQGFKEPFLEVKGVAWIVLRDKI